VRYFEAEVTYATLVGRSRVPALSRPTDLKEGPMIEFAKAGSQRWLQIAVEQSPSVMARAVRRAMGLPDGVTIDWVSPRQADDFREYRDGAALRRLGIPPLEVRPLSDFWPARGPVWDGLARTSDDRFLFVEAKAHIPELASPETRATPDSMTLIVKSLDEARRHYAPKAKADWSRTFYQYANRLAHHYLFRHVNGLPAHLLFVNFLNADDVRGPTKEAEWHGAIRLLHAALGLGESFDLHVHDVFVDVNDLRPGR
jgi:hypothetical protein